MASLIGRRGMPHVYAFQFWALRGQIPTGSPFVAGPGNWFGSSNFSLMYVVCTANTAGTLWGATVTVTIGQFNWTFEFIDVGGSPAPGNVGVEVATGATAAQVATALAAAVNNEFGNVGLTVGGFVASASPPGFATGTCSIGTIDPAYGPAMRIQTGIGSFQLGQPAYNRPYGATVLRSSWKAFVCTGNSTGDSPALDLSDPSMFWVTAGIVGTHTPRGRWAMPMQLFTEGNGEEPA